MAMAVTKKMNKIFSKMAVAAILDLCMNKSQNFWRMLEMTLYYEIHRDKWYYTSFSDENWKIYIF